MDSPKNHPSLATNARKGRRSRTATDTSAAPALSEQDIFVMGGRFAPLDRDEQDQIHTVAMTLLSKTGLAAAPAEAIALVTAAGGTYDADRQRLLFPESLVTRVLGKLQRGFALFGRGTSPPVNMEKYHVHVGTGGAAPHILDFATRRYRAAQLQDLFAAARLVDGLKNFHFFSRPVVARDITDPLRLDIHTAYASLRGTSKHILVSASSLASVKAIASMCYQIAGSETAFRAAPFLSLNINHVVPPLRFDTEACDILIAAARHGIPVMVNTFGQLGASSPVTIAGCVAQTTAETLAGMVIAYLAAADVRAIFGPRPMITDLRSGAMSGGSGEQALLTATAVQMAHYYDLPNSTIAGATDSKMPDTQSGYEKCLTVSLAVQAGANMITQAGGTQASLMGLSLESLVIDNDMLGSILRTVPAVDVSPQTLSADDIAAVATGAGHFLGETQTYARMNSDFLYPKIADRNPIAAWENAGSRDLLDRAHAHVDTILSEPADLKIDPQLDAALRRQFDIDVPALV